MHKYLIGRQWIYYDQYVHVLYRHIVDNNRC